MPFKYKEQRKEYLKEYVQRPEVKKRRNEQAKRSYQKFKKTFFVQNFNTKKRSSNKKFPDRIFNITAEYLQEIFPEDKKCPVLNIELKVNNFGPGDHSPSIDRVDNDKGYEIGNVIWVCQKVNNIKTNATPDEIIKVGEFYKKLLEEKDRNIE
jgi:hypothetical protein